MLDVISQAIEATILSTNAAMISDVFIAFMAIGFLLACLFKRIDKLHAYTQYAPTLLTTIGILGTFFGIVYGLLAFDVKDINGSIEGLLSGMKTAFTTSLVGMSLSVFYKLLISFGLLYPKNGNVIDEDQLGIAELYQVMSEQRDGIAALTSAVGGGDEASLTGQIKLMRSDANDATKETRASFLQFQEKLWVQLQDFADMLSRSATETVVEALSKVIADFNQNLTEQFGENFKQLNDAVFRLVEWQENYKEQLAEMSVQYKQGVESITDTEAAVARIGEHAIVIPQTMEHLQQVMTVNQHQIEELERHLQAFKDVRDKAVEAVPELDARIEQTLAGIESATTSLADGLTKASQEVLSTLNNGTEQLINGVTQSSAALVESSQAVANNSEQIKVLFEDSTTGIHNSFREMSNLMAEHTQNISVHLKDAGQALLDEAHRSRQSFENGLDQLRDKLADTLTQAATQHTGQMQSLQDGVRKAMESAIRDTSQAIENEVKTLDKAIEHEINSSMSSMGQALASITGTFTEDYRKLVNEMDRVVRAHQ